MQKSKLKNKNKKGFAISFEALLSFLILTLILLKLPYQTTSYDGTIKYLQLQDSAEVFNLMGGFSDLQNGNYTGAEEKISAINSELRECIGMKFEEMEFGCGNSSASFEEKIIIERDVLVGEEWKKVRFEINYP